MCNQTAVESQCDYLELLQNLNQKLYKSSTLQPQSAKFCMNFILKCYITIIWKVVWNIRGWYSTALNPNFPEFYLEFPKYETDLKLLRSFILKCFFRIFLIFSWLTVRLPMKVYYRAEKKTWCHRPSLNKVSPSDSPGGSVRFSIPFSSHLTHMWPNTSLYCT